VPRLWNETIAAHRRDVRDAIVEASSRLVTEHGVRAVTMSRIAETTGIGRATLYKYFPSLEAILVAWHERQIADHLEQLAEVSERRGGPVERLEAVLHAYALTVHETHGQHDAELAAYLHRNEHLAEGRRALHALIRDLVTEAARTGEIRSDVTAEELATYCLHAARAAGHLTSKGEVHKLVMVILSGMRGV
jgi:AcrR family transcriptional regulator